MLGTLRYYLYRAGVDGQTLDAAASELWNDVILEALHHEGRFPNGVQPRAWLLGIAANLVKRRQAELSRLNRREPLARDLYPDDAMSDDDVFDLIAELTSASYEIDADETVGALLATLSTEDQQVVRLAIIHGLNGEALANELGVSRGAARVRLHRALGRLRQAYTLQRDENNDTRI